ncbi:MAG: glycosyltransferase family 2 protein [Puniceicoccales bacterium]
MTDLSFVIPSYNERESLRPLYNAIVEAMSQLPDLTWKIHLIDDGSTDGSWREIQSIASRDPDHFTAIRFRRNFGKAEALQVGFDHSDGSTVITMDADLQDDPKAIPDFLAKINEGFDLVSGWKRKRHDPKGKVLPSRVFNILARAASGVRLHDFNCGFKAYRREVVDQIRLYGEMHRFTPILAAAEGFRIGEIEVPHHPRTFGHSKYGTKRFIKGFLDLATVTVMTRYLRRPAHVFGGFGTGSLAVGFSVLFYLSFRKIVFGINIEQRPLFFLGILLLLLGVQLISIGILAELVNYHSRKDEKSHIAEMSFPDAKNLEPPKSV